MGLKVIGLDISDPQLETAKAVGADYVFNTKTDADYVKKILKLTGGGVDAAVNYTASKRVRNVMIWAAVVPTNMFQRRTTMLPQLLGKSLLFVRLECRSLTKI
jgi:threonine dehydrogenase-like Zn-dependent dehydrogenase